MAISSQNGLLAIWPFDPMASKMANMGISGKGYKNAAIWWTNRIDSTFLQEMRAIIIWSMQKESRVLKMVKSTNMGFSRNSYKNAAIWWRNQVDSTFLQEIRAKNVRRQIFLLYFPLHSKQALYAIVFSLGFAFEVKTRMLRTQITYFNPI